MNAIIKHGVIDTPADLCSPDNPWAWDKRTPWIYAEYEDGRIVPLSATRGDEDRRHNVARARRVVDSMIESGTIDEEPDWSAVAPAAGGSGAVVLRNSGILGR